MPINKVNTIYNQGHWGEVIHYPTFDAGKNMRRERRERERRVIALQGGSRSPSAAGYLLFPLSLQVYAHLPSLLSPLFPCSLSRYSVS